MPKDRDDQEKPAGMRKEPGEDARPETRVGMSAETSDIAQRNPTEDSRPMTEEPYDAGVQSGSDTQQDWRNPEQRNVRDESEREEGRMMHQLDRHTPGARYKPGEPKTSIGGRTETSPVAPRDRTTERPQQPDDRSGSGGPRMTGETAEDEAESEESPTHGSGKDL